MKKPSLVALVVAVALVSTTGCRGMGGLLRGLAVAARVAVVVASAVGTVARASQRKAHRPGNPEDDSPSPELYGTCRPPSHFTFTGCFRSGGFPHHVGMASCGYYCTDHCAFHPAIDGVITVASPGR